MFGGWYGAAVGAVRGPRREIHESLQVVEQRNSGNDTIFHGKDAELTGADRYDLQSALALINTRLVDRVLEDPVWVQRIDPASHRGLTPPYWSNGALHGRFNLNMDSHLDFARGPQPTRQPTTAPV